MTLRSALSSGTELKCVYTVLLGQYETLNEQPKAKDTEIPFICLTDDLSLRSDSWDCRQVDPVFPFDSIRSQRDIKIRPHLYLPEFVGSLYIDNGVVLKRPPEQLFALMDPAVGFLVPKHSFRQSVLDEFLTVSQLGYDDNSRIFEQLNHYMLESPEILDEIPWWTAILVRDHRHVKVQKVLEIWASHVQRYSRRDQLSLNYAFRAAGLRPNELNIDNLDSEFHSWPVAMGRGRKLRTYDAARSLMPGRAQLRSMELQLAERDGRLAALRRRLAKREKKLKALHSSWSWRLTAPMRLLFRYLRGAFDKLKWS